MHADCAREECSAERRIVRNSEATWWLAINRLYTGNPIVSVITCLQQLEFYGLAFLGGQGDCAMVNCILSDLRAGWAIATISDGSRAVTISASSTPTDALRDFVDAVQSLQTARTADCCWFQERGELHWKLRRRETSLDVEIVRFDYVSFPGRHGDGGTPVFVAQTECLISLNGCMVLLLRYAPSWVLKVSSAENRHFTH